MKFHNILIHILTLFALLSCEAEQPVSDKKPQDPPARDQRTIVDNEREFLKVYRGKNAMSRNDETCYLYVLAMDAHYDHYHAEVISSFQPTLKFHLTQYGVVFKSENNANNEFLDADIIDQENRTFTRYVIKYLHGNHFHNEICIDLEQTLEYPHLDELEEDDDDHHDHHDH